MTGLFYEDALEALTAAGVRFVIVGGVAVNLQGVPRFTADLDIAVAVDGFSLAAASRALSALGLRNRLPVQEDDLVRPEARASVLRVDAPPPRD